MAEAILIQPRTALTGSLVRMIPIGLLYAASSAVQHGHSIKILDCRLHPDSWPHELMALVTPLTRIVGVSVMTGVSILESLAVSRHVAQNFPWVKVVWGGPHVTFSPHGVIEDAPVDFLVRGYGAQAFCDLLEYLERGELDRLSEIPGLSWKDKAEQVHHNEVVPAFEFIDYRDIPYHLIADYTLYYHADASEIVFPMYSVMGCPYSCGFCSSPALYGEFGNRWVPYPVEQVVEHIRFVQERYGATYIYFIDDDSFVDRRHVEALIDTIAAAGIEVKLGFRGARINELLGMDDDFLTRLAAAGTRTLHIGVESGSDRILDLMGKNITVQQILEVNRTLARHPEIMALYNFIVGYPTETMEETLLTRDLILRLIEENPRCIVIPLNKPRPLPGTPLMELALQHGYLPPKSLEEWGVYDVESTDYRPPWLSPEHDRFIRMMFLCMYFIDDKIFKFSSAAGPQRTLLRMAALLYKPLAMLRFRFGFDRLLIENRLYTWFNKVLS
ncbi:MAG: radical SAM protein [Pelobacteraceae bacterium]